MDNARKFRITGMDCAGCARSIETGVAKLEGVATCEVNFTAAVLSVQGSAPDAAIAARIRALGYGVQEAAQQAAPASETATPWLGALAVRLPKTGLLGFIAFLLARPTTAFALLGAVLILPVLLLQEIGPMFTGTPFEAPWLSALAILAMAAAGWPIARSAWRAITINREVNINVLMTIAAIGALIIGAYAEAGLVMVLFAIGEALEGYTSDRARDAIRGLMQLAQEEAIMLSACMDCKEHLGQEGYAGGPCPFCGIEESLKPVANIAIGDCLLIKPGARIPLDGVIASGASSVDQSPITGESVPVDKHSGENVYAGSINGTGVLEVRVTHLAADSTISRIIRMVEDAQARKAPVERFVDRFAKIYTPAVVGLAVLVAMLPPLLTGAGFWGEGGWLYRALTLLVVACPCALVISTPVSLISAIGNAARNGVLIKGGAHLETLNRIKAFAFDKTGTLTMGKPRVIEVRSVQCAQPLSGPSCAACDDLLALASAVERRSEHPLAQAVVDAARDSQLDARYAPAEAVTALAGKGVSGRVAGQDVLIGSHAYFDNAMAHDQADCAAASRAAADGMTPIMIGANDRYLGYIALADVPRPESHQAITALHAAGIAKTIMLTGDNAATAQAIARATGVTDVRAELLPEHKADAIKALVAEHGAVAMVGDGINDAPALATATLGIAMGAGTAQAMETADVALIGNDLGKLAFALKLSRAAMRTVRLNIAFAIGIKLVFLALVLVGAGSMWLAVLADVGAAIAVTLFGMRLLRWHDASPAAHAPQP